ncbi:gamma-butyrobetaine dioxygenase-like [Teleopsis dalmanni]|uniref:gamma-butyrobetaine dioxygenase-like n=1 Tax=Teleopsis dalmanni TaxID=139649 RepID=UPI0018CF6A2B|nr:gamma-butyrobetaine dioxygenase-like [Teleopsis dalmanni]XP_037954190.1 gamma-butyrobetaine dioxygenase-like [Teleopsis dalmanni]
MISTTQRSGRQLVATTKALKCFMRSISVSVQEQQDQSVQMVLVKEHEKQQQTMKFPGIWLRDNCLCDECFHKDSLSRKPLRWNNFDMAVKVQHIVTDDSKNAVKINWSDKHTSTFDLNWLKERDFSTENRQKYISEWYRPESKHWSKPEFQKILKKFEYKDVMEKDESLLQLLETLAVYGVCLLKNSPLDIGVVKTLADRVGFIRKTTYGEEFSVKSRPGAKNYSYLAEPLPLHTDLPYYEYKPSVTILHTLEQSQSTGGWNTLTDAFNIADQLRVKHPKHFKILTETPVDWCDIGVDGGVEFHNIWRAPVINLDADGKYARINHSVPQRDNHFSVDIDKVAPWYAAYAMFVRMAHEQAVSFKTAPGDVLTFNNLRMLHGRTGYDDTEKNVRHIVGGFVDWDIIYSRMRVLRKMLN